MGGIVTHYEVLGVAAGATVEEVRNAYLRLARRWHPDAHVGADSATQAAAARQMQRVNEAWRVLGDVRRRHAYDLALGGWARATAPDPEPESGDDDSWDWMPEPPIVEASPRSTAMAVLPMLLVGVSVASFSAALVIGITALLAVSVLALGAAGLLFLLMPLLAMTAARRQERVPPPAA